MKTVFCSDLHYLHKNICDYTDRKLVTTPEKHTEWLTELWNKEVQPEDTVWHLGDFCFSTKYDVVAGIVRGLSGNKNFIKGNHCDARILNKLKEDGLINNWYDYKEIKLGEDRIPVCLFHFPVACWHKQGYGSWHLHGHCVDDKTEILTASGWKYREDLVENEPVYSYNIENNTVELDKVKEIIDVNYTGSVFSYKGKSVNFRTTSNHTQVLCNSNMKITKELTSNLSGRLSFITSGVQQKEQVLSLTPNDIILYILIAADGSIKHQTNLVRLRVKRLRKITYFRSKLKEMGVLFKEHLQKDGSLSFDFYLPLNLQRIKIKGLDSILMDCNQEQFEALMEGYLNSDGTKQSNGLVIYSQKEAEIDLIQALCPRFGYMSTKYSRYHGLGGNIQHQLSITKNFKQRFNPKKLEQEEVISEHFWCVKTTNQTFICRREGRVHITGNSHGNYFLPDGKILDVGLDSAYNLYGEHKFFTEEMIEEYMKTRTVKVQDHHTYREGEITPKKGQNEINK